MPKRNQISWTRARELARQISLNSLADGYLSDEECGAIITLIEQAPAGLGARALGSEIGVDDPHEYEDDGSLYLDPCLTDDARPQERTSQAE